MDSTDLQLEEPERLGTPAPFSYPPVSVSPSRPRILVPLVLFLTTVVTTLIAGTILEVGFLHQAGLPGPVPEFSVLTNPRNWILGVPFSVTLLAILVAHELGHYLACRYYGIDATYPYVLPAPPLFNPFGTFGAVIRIRSPFYNSRQLFDVGIAGPIAGFAVLLPALVVGLSLSTVFRGTIGSGDYEFGEPLLFKWLSNLTFSEAGGAINLHPVGFAAWFGMLATSLNLLPIGQLDGGHIVYAILGSKLHKAISIGGVLFLGGVSLLSWPMPGYLVFGLLLFFIGMRHPRPVHEGFPVGTERLVLAAVALVILVVTFMAVPIRVV